MTMPHFRFLRRARPTRNEFTFIRRVGGNGYYVWSDKAWAYVEEVEHSQDTPNN